MTPLSRGLGLVAVLSLSASTAVGCTASLAQYPEAGEPGPVVTAGGDTIPEGPDRDAFMAGYEAGFERAKESGGSYAVRMLGGAAGGMVAGWAVPGVLLGGFFYAPAAAMGIGLIAASGSLGRTPPLTRLPASVVDQGPLYADGYREGYFRGLQTKRQDAATGGAVLGAGFGLILLIALASGA